LTLYGYCINTANFLKVLIEVLRVTLNPVTILIISDIRQVYSCNLNYKSIVHFISF